MFLNIFGFFFCSGVVYGIFFGTANNSKSYNSCEGCPVKINYSNLWQYVWLCLRTTTLIGFFFWEGVIVSSTEGLFSVIHPPLLFSLLCYSDTAITINNRAGDSTCLLFISSWPLTHHFIKGWKIRFVPASIGKVIQHWTMIITEVEKKIWLTKMKTTSCMSVQAVAQMLTITDWFCVREFFHG